MVNTNIDPAVGISLPDLAKIYTLQAGTSSVLIGDVQALCYQGSLLYPMLPASAQICPVGELDRDYELLYPTLRADEADDIEMEDFERISDDSMEMTASEPSDIDETTDEEEDELPGVSHTGTTLMQQI